MPVLCRKQVRNFTVLPNEMLQDTHLSCCDLGLLVQMLSRPDNWVFSTSGLNALYAGRTGKESLAKSVKRLQALGYLTITQERTPSGKLGAAVWTVYDSPYSGKPESGFPPYKKERTTKEEPATPAFGGGQKPGLFFDDEGGIWRRKA